MKRIEQVYREILYQVLEKKRRRMTQLGLSKSLGISLSLVHHAIKPLVRMNAVDVGKRNFVVIDAKKILLHWASIRNLEKDIIFRTRIEKPVRTIESEMPDTIVYGVYSAYKFTFKDVPADYSEVFVYGDVRLPENKNTPNVFVLKADPLLERYGKTTTMAQMFVDIWNIRSWYAREFVKALEVKIDGILE